MDPEEQQKLIKEIQRNPNLSSVEKQRQTQLILRGKRMIDQSNEHFISYNELLESSKKQKNSINETKFPNAWTEYGFEPRPLLEYELNEFSGLIRGKKNWVTKMHDSVIWKKWADGHSEAMMKYVKAELEWYAANHPGPIQKSGVDAVYFFDDLMPENIIKDLLKGVSQLENVPDHLKDWHPGSSNQVLDLVHPSLYCLVFGKTLGTKEQIRPSLKAIGMGKKIQSQDGHGYTFSEKFQWLPSEFIVSPEGKVTIDSYINNLHPIKFKGLYSTIASIFEQFVPLFNKTLTNMLNPTPGYIKVDPYDWYEENKQNEENEDEDYDRNDRTLKQIEIPPFSPPPPPVQKIDLYGKTLQVIVKLANIELTPENPHYSGGSWHVEGMENENIVASGIYYYHSENITESFLDFRVATEEPGYEQNDDKGVREVYGLANDEALVQRIGSIETKQGRCISFPNVYQHQVQPFTLIDKEKPGSRKILVFFLVNPSKRIVSTANVPPQQSDWLFASLRNKSPFSSLPKDILNHIENYLSFPMSLVEAKKHREELMKERKYFTERNTEEVFERPFSLCEH